MKQVIFYVDITSPAAAAPTLDEAIASGQAKFVPSDSAATPLPPAQQAAGVPAPPPPPPTSGPGTELKKLLKLIRITATPDCSCHARARTMDERGCDWCEEHIDEIVGWLREEAGRRKLPFVDAAGRMLVRRAIRNARKAETASPEN